MFHDGYTPRLHHLSINFELEGQLIAEGTPDEREYTMKLMILKPDEHGNNGTEIKDKNKNNTYQHLHQSLGHPGKNRMEQTIKACN
ncbi:hypothetical protein HMI55_000578 [Coelomomyces lativittatus]|nr:hypothetical protein HMI55_000578 [Coelomomyces lativittatus]